MKYRLRPYQARALVELERSIDQGFRAPLLVAATGAGKTVLACAFIERMTGAGVRTLFLAHRSELISQPSRKLDEMGMEHGIIKAGMERGHYGMPLQLASVQTYDRRAGRVPANFGLIVVDEAHHAAAATYRRAISRNSNGRRPLVVGLTATPYRADGAALGDLFDTIIPVADTAELTREGFLAHARVFRGRQALDFFGLKQVAGDYDEGELGRRMNRPRLVGHVVEEYVRLAYGRSAVCFAVDVAHSKAICAAFTAAGVPAEHLDGTTPAGEREAILGRLMSGKTLVVVNCGVLTEGFDCARVSAIIGARPTKSRCLWRQMPGRGLRICPEIGKADCLILDHAGWTAEHGYLTDPDRVTLEGGLVKGRPSVVCICPACGARLAARPARCPECGAELGGPGPDGPVDLGDPSQSLVEDLAGLHPPIERAAYVPRAPRTERLRRRPR